MEIVTHPSFLQWSCLLFKDGRDLDVTKSKVTAEEMVKTQEPVNKMA